MDISAINEDLANIDAQINDLLRALSNGFQKLDKVKDPNRQSRQLEELTEKMRECKRLIKEFDRELKVEESQNTTSVIKMLNDRKQAMIKELNSFVALKKQYGGNLGNKRNELFDAHEAGPGPGEEGVFLASSMTNQQLMDAGDRMMNETDQAIERSKKVVHDTVNVGGETAAALKAQTEQMSRIVNELDSIHFSMKKATQLVKEIGRQIVNPKNKDIRDIPGLAPPVNRKLLWDHHYYR
ncbi:novel plant SNARE 11-like isoform X2 [Phalaenopsis equestris]|uniref:novel plant SNARE 11-like isoform X2 n=1 Tax=Phalaenopsis equestris TaxID=78828 RepID=UPI0009E61E81|nr:novel plant SNARE 11-like isoform X2 [Phalaenopsis equestris]